MQGAFERLRTAAQGYLRRLKSSEYVFMILIGALIGLGGGLGAVGFRHLIRTVQRVAYGSWSYNLDVVRAIPWYILIFIPAIGGLFVAPLVFRLAREAKGHGVPEVMESVALRGGVIRARVVLVKALASAIDKRTILDSVAQTPWRIDACGVIPPQIPGYQGCGEVGYEFDVQAAQEHLEVALDEMGVDDPADITVNLWFNHESEDIIGAVAEQWETNLGVKVNAVTMEWAAYLDALSGCNNP